MKKLLYGLLGAGLLIIGILLILAVRAGYFDPNGPFTFMTNDMLLYKSFSVQGTVQNTILYTNGRIDVYCEGIPICEVADIGTTTHQISVADMSVIEQLLTDSSSRSIFKPEPGVVYESSYKVVTNFRGRRLSGTNDAVAEVLEIIAKYTDSASTTVPH